MMRTADDIVTGISRYAEREIMPKLDTKSKVVMGALLGMATNSMSKVAEELRNNDLAKMVGAVDADGHFDVDLVADNLKKSSTQYGPLSFSVPLTGGQMSFSPDDIEIIKWYVNGER